MRKSWFVVGVAAIALAGGIWVMRHRPLPVQVLSPETDVTLRLYGLGTVEARVLSEVGFELGGAVQSLSADAGDRVLAGQELARLHPEEQQARVAQAEAGVEAARAALAKAEAALPRAQAVLSQREAANTRQQELARTDRASKQSAEETQRDLDVARADLAVAETELMVLRAQAAEADANLQSARTLLEKHVLAAPYDALIIARKAEAGTVVKAGVNQAISKWQAATAEEPSTRGDRTRHQREAFRRRVWVVIAEDPELSANLVWGIDGPGGVDVTGSRIRSVVDLVELDGSGEDLDELAAWAAAQPAELQALVAGYLGDA